MENMKYLLLGLIFFMLQVKPKSINYKARIYHSYIEGHMNSWKQTIDEMQAQKIKPDAFILQLLNYQYGYIRWCISKSKKNEAEKYINTANKNIRILEKQHYEPSYVNAYKSAIYAFIIDLHPFRAPFIGPKSLDAAKLSMKQDTTNPYGYLQYAHALYYMPTIFGGSKTKAIQYYLKAEHWMERNPQKLKDNWNYLNLLTILAQAYKNTKQFKKAYEYYQLILKKEPEFILVKNKLLPNFLRKYKAYVK